MSHLRPRLQTPRLVLRPFELVDAPAVQRLAGDARIADTTLSIPHPYEDGMAEQWIATHQPRFEAGELVNFAVTLCETGELVGAIGLEVRRSQNRAELGYWIGVPFWNRGYCTEAARAVLAHGFDAVGLDRIFAHHLTRNPTSGRVMRKLGLRHEGTLRAHFIKNGRREDVEVYGILRGELCQGRDGRSLHQHDPAVGRD